MTSYKVETSQETDSQRCPLCNCEDAQVARTEKDGTLVKCASCSFFYVSPRPTEQELKLRYDEEYFEGGNLDSFLDYRHPVFRQVLARVSKFHLTKRRMLDVGCGTGEFLQDALEEGWEVEGIESSHPAAEFARNKKQLPVHHATLQNAPFAPESFSVITLLDVLEHLRDPREEMLRVWNLLESGGIAVVRLPNTNFHLLKCRICDAMRITDYGLQMRFHLNHFTPATMTTLLQQTGFRPLSIDIGASETIAHSPWASPSVKKLYVAGAQALKAVTGLNIGNILVAYGRKID